MHPIRIIPCLDIKDAKVVKGKNFLDLKNVGEPLQLAKDYNCTSSAHSKASMPVSSFPAWL